MWQWLQWQFCNLVFITVKFVTGSRNSYWLYRHLTQLRSAFGNITLYNFNIPFRSFFKLILSVSTITAFFRSNFGRFILYDRRVKSTCLEAKFNENSIVSTVKLQRVTGICVPPKIVLWCSPLCWCVWEFENSIIASRRRWANEAYIS